MVYYFVPGSSKALNWKSFGDAGLLNRLRYSRGASQDTSWNCLETNARDWKRMRFERKEMIWPRISEGSSARESEVDDMVTEEYPRFPCQPKYQLLEQFNWHHEGRGNRVRRGRAGGEDDRFSVHRNTG